MFRKPSGNCLPPNIPLSSSKSSGLGSILMDAKAKKDKAAYDVQSLNVDSDTKKGTNVYGDISLL